MSPIIPNILRHHEISQCFELVSRDFTPRRIREMEPSIRAIQPNLRCPPSTITSDETVLLEIHLHVGVGHPVSVTLLGLAGLFVGYVAGMFGIGGGFLLTPLLIFGSHQWLGGREG